MPNGVLGVSLDVLLLIRRAIGYVIYSVPENFFLEKNKKKKERMESLVKEKNKIIKENYFLSTVPVCTK